MRILFVGMANSVHLVRWVNQLDGQGWEVHLFPVESVTPNPLLRNAVIHDAVLPKHQQVDLHQRVELRDEFWPVFGANWPLRRGAYRVKRILGHWFPSWDDRSWRLGQTIQRLKPDIVHSHEFQHAAYLTLDAKKHVAGKFPQWIVSNWGHDVYLFSRLAAHREKLEALLSQCDYYTCECTRDIELARACGLTGKVLGVVPNCGGFDIEAAKRLRQPGPTSARRTIALKGYQNFYGRALFGLRAIALAADVLKDYRIVIYSATSDVAIAAELVAHATKLKIEVLPHCSHDEMLRLHGMSRISIGVGISDAASISFLEALVMGSFPIQSNTSCANEWVECGKSGFLVPPEDPEIIARAIRRAVTDDALVDIGAQINARTAADRLDQSVIRPKVLKMYEVVAEGITKIGVNQV